MFASFFPNPRIFFPAAVLWTALTMAVWYGFARNLGPQLSLGWVIGFAYPPESADGAAVAVETARNIWLYEYMIVTGGMNVYPAEVERVLALADGVGEVAVFGVADARWGETVTAAVVARPGRSVDVDAVTAFARERLAGYKKPTAIHVVDELPRNASLKVKKDVLRHRFDHVDG